MSTAMMQSDIQAFYENKSIFITGCTGFLGKVLLEKLLRSCPGIESIYVLMRSKKGKDIESRVEEVCSGDIFEKLRQQQPEFKQKIIAVKGDVAQEGLGIDEVGRKTLIEKVSIIFHVAATVLFDAPLNTAVAINVRGTKEVIDLARECKKLESILHVSTAYSHCPRKKIEEKFYASPCDPQELINIVNETSHSDMPAVTKRLLSVWPNTYSFTKAVSEEVVRVNGSGLPICVFRPAIVTAASAEPIPGWVDNINGPAGFLFGVGMGVLRVCKVDPKCTTDMVPVDLVVNSMIAISYKTANARSNAIPVYNYVSSPQNPIRWKESTETRIKLGASIPSEKCIWCVSLVCIKNPQFFQLAFVLLHYLPALLVDTAAILTGRKPQLMSVYKKIAKILEAFAFFTTREWEFTNQNTRKLWAELSDRDRGIFPFDISGLHWKTYFFNEVRGVRKYIFKEDPERIPAARKRHFRLKILHRAVQGILLVLFAYVLYFILSK